MKWYLFILGMLLNAAMYGIAWRVLPRVDVGLGWHQFASYENYLPAADVSIVNFLENITTGFNIMGFFGGSARAFIGHHFNMQGIIQAGILRNGVNAEVKNTRNTTEKADDFIRYGTVNGHVAITDINMGVLWPSPCYIVVFNPLLGYIFNQEAFGFCTIGSRDRYCINNKWQGGYAGFESVLNVTDSFFLKAGYKFVFGNVRSKLNSALTAESLALAPALNSSVSNRCGRMYGNIFLFDIGYRRDCWSVGTSVFYYQYRNHRPLGVSFASDRSPLIKSGSLLQIFWEQLAWTLFGEFMY